MPRFLSPEWVTAFNAALEQADLFPIGTEAPRAVPEGPLRIAQVVVDPPPELGEHPSDQEAPAPYGAPQGASEARTGSAPPNVIHTLLVVEGGRVSLSLHRPSGPTPGAGDERPDVTVVLSYADAAALSQGQLDPIDALGSGRLRVRGDLALLVAAQSLLAAAATRLGELQAATTY